jgi:hypothetical protein
MWYCLGGNALWALWVAAAWFAARAAVRLARGGSAAQLKIKTA